MTPVSLVACIVVLWASVRSRFGSIVLARAERFTPSPWLARASGCALVAAFAGQLVLVALQARYDNVGPLADWMSSLPLPVYDYHGSSAALHPLFCDAGYALALFEVACLATVYAATRRGSTDWSPRATAVASVALAVLSLAAPAMSTTDPYEYVAAGMLGMAAYAPPPAAFAHSVYASIASHIPMRGVLYGPLWLALDTAVTRFLPSIVAKVEALRLLGALLVGALLWLLARAGVSRAALTVLALNPALWYLFVVNVHADVQCLVLVAAAYLFAQRSKGIVAMLLVFAGGMIKFPFVLAGAAAFAPLERPGRRLLLWTGAVLLVFVASYLVPGPIYLTGVFAHAGHMSARAVQRGVGAYVTMVPFDCALMLAFVALRSSAPGAAWFFGQLSPVVASWYLFWGLPYALGSGTLALFLIPLPLLTAMLDFSFRAPTPILQFCVVAAVACVFAFDLYLIVRGRGAPKPYHVSP